MIRKEQTFSSSLSSTQPLWTCRLPSRNLVTVKNDDNHHFHDDKDDWHGEEKDDDWWGLSMTTGMREYDDWHGDHSQLRLAALEWKELSPLTHSLSLPSGGDYSYHHHHHPMLYFDFCVCKNWGWPPPSPSSNAVSWLFGTNENSVGQPNMWNQSLLSPQRIIATKLSSVNGRISLSSPSMLNNAIMNCYKLIDQVW